MKFQPVGDKILVRKIERKIDSALVLPEWCKSSETFAEVVRLGTYNLDSKQRRTQEWPVKVGDTVTFSNRGDIGKKIDDEDLGECLLVHIGQINTVIEGE